MRCPACGFKNKNDSLYCATCGAHIQIREEGEYSNKDYAGFWKRFVAAIIDALVMMGANIIIGIILGFSIGVLVGLKLLEAESMKLIITIVSYAISILANWLYFALMESSERQATLGKSAMGIYVTDGVGCRISFGQATGRYFGKFYQQ